MRIVFSAPKEGLEATGMAGIHIDHLEERLRPWLKHAEQHAPESVDAGVDLE